MNISTKAYLKKPDSSGISRIYIHFRAGCKIDAVNLNLNVHFSNFDPVKGVVKDTCTEGTTLNKAIRNAASILENLAADLPDSDFKHLKLLYLAHIAEQKKTEVESITTTTSKIYMLKEDATKSKASIRIQKKIDALEQQINELRLKQMHLNTAIAEVKQIA